MILRLYDHIGSSRHDDDINLPESPIPRIGEWVHFHKDEADWRKGLYRIVSVEYAIQRGKLIPLVVAHEASEQHYQQAKTAIHDEHGDAMTDLMANRNG